VWLSQAPAFSRLFSGKNRSALRTSFRLPLHELSPLPRAIGAAGSVIIRPSFVARPLTRVVWAPPNYVATNGNDLAAGTLAAPFASVARAQTAAVAGDTVYVRGAPTPHSRSRRPTPTITMCTASIKARQLGGVSRRDSIFDFSSVPTSLRVLRLSCHGFGPDDHRIRRHGCEGRHPEASECFRIDGSAAFVDSTIASRRQRGQRFLFHQSRPRSCNRCDSYNNIGTNGDSIGNTTASQRMAMVHFPILPGLEQQR